MALDGPNIIGDVTETIVDLLKGPNVTLNSPAALKVPDDEPKNLNLYLYEVIENQFGKNRAWVSTSPNEQQYPPLALNLHYMLTPYAEDAGSAHAVLSHTMRVLHDHSILTGPLLKESLRQMVDKLAIVLIPMKLEGLTRIWNALQSPYRLSVCYDVKVVLIESTRERIVGRVTSKINEYSQILKYENETV